MVPIEIIQKRQFSHCLSFIALPFMKITIKVLAHIFPSLPAASLCGPLHDMICPLLLGIMSNKLSLLPDLLALIYLINNKIYILKQIKIVTRYLIGTLQTLMCKGITWTSC